MALNMIGKLYRIEREIKALTPEDKYRERQARSVPALEKLKAWLDKHYDKVPKDSLTGTAMVYLRNQWPKLIRYCEDGRLPISNCGAENAIRPFVIGRKAWLFSDTPKGAKASAIYYSLIESAKANGLDPYAYLRQMLAQLPYADSVEKYEALLPWNIKLGGN
jgi:transposase